MRNLSRLLRALHEPLPIEPRAGAALVDLLGRATVRGERFTGTEIHAELEIEMEEPRTARGKGRKHTPKIGIIPIHGVIDRRAQSLGTGVDLLEAQFERMLQDTRVDAILFDIDSPGGSSDGVPEFADKVFSARGTKPLMALADGIMASAAYWIGSAADEIAITPSSQAGSIGVWAAHEDWSRWLGNEGIEVTALSAGKYKLEGAPWEPLTDEAREHFQERVDEVYGWFVRAVANHRRDTQKNVRAGYGEGRVLGAEESVSTNLADRVATFDEAVERLASRVERKGKSTNALRNRLRLQELDSARSGPYNGAVAKP